MYLLLCIDNNYITSLFKINSVHIAINKYINDDDEYYRILNSTFPNGIGGMLTSRFQIISTEEKFIKLFL